MAYETEVMPTELMGAVCLSYLLLDRKILRTGMVFACSPLYSLSVPGTE